MKNPARTSCHENNGRLDRRSLLQWATTTSLAAGTSSLLAEDQVARAAPRVCVYTEHFQSLPVPEVCKIFRTMGVNGLDLTVRPGGHVDPEDVKTGLPKAVKAARDQGLEVMMLTTAITEPDRIAEETFAACQQAGIRRIKMGYYPVGKAGALARRLSEVRRQLAGVAKLAARYEVLPCMHLHSGSTIPSNGFMLYDLLREIPPDRIGAYLDSFHMTITAGAGGWKQAIDLLTPWISLVALKNFQWHRGKRDELGQQRWRTDYCRLEDGVAPIPDFVKAIHRAGYRGFYTLHTEYRKPVKECIQLTTEDFTYLRKVFATL